MLISPREFGETLTEGMQMLGKVWRKLIPPSFATFVILGAVTIVTFMLTDADDFVNLVMTDPEAIERYSDQQLFDMAGRLGLATLVIGLASALAIALLSLIVHRLVGSELGRTPTTPGKATLFAAGRLPAMVFTMILTVIAVGIGLLLFVIPGVWIGISMAMIAPVVALEGLGPVAAMRRSAWLVRGRWWQTIGFLVLVGLMGTVAGQLVQLVALPTLAAGGVTLVAGLGFVALMVTQGFITAAILVMTTMWYVDLRARKEQLISSSLS
jgi:hypothetical protein